MALERIYEKCFSDNSHGFRPGRSRHSALGAIKTGWKGISWFLEFDLHKCFDSMDRHRLVRLLRDKIEDQQLFDLLHKM